FYHPWSEWNACFKRSDDEITTRNRTCSEKGECSHLGESVQYKKCMCTNCDDDGDDDDDDDDHHHDDDHEDDNDDDRKTVTFYLSYVGLPLLAMLFVMVTLVSCCYCICKKKKSSNTVKPLATTYVNSAFETPLDSKPRATRNFVMDTCHK
ncbi:Hypothetical predicted protein, partial [Paramuricea clavata]